METYEEQVIRIWEHVRRVYDEDTAQEVALRLFETVQADPVRYGQAIARKVRISLKYPDRENNKWVLRDVLTADGLMWGDSENLEKDTDPGPLERLLSKETFKELESEAPQWVRAVVTGGPRMAECHPERRNCRRGLCKSCVNARDRLRAKQKRGQHAAPLP